MALVDLTSVTTGSIGTNTNFIVEENKVLKRISQSSLLKTSAISTTQVNSTTNVPSSSLVYSMNQSINKLNSDFTKSFSPVTTGSFKNIDNSGIFYVTNAVSDKPNTTTGGFYALARFDDVNNVGIFISKDPTISPCIVSDNGAYNYSLVKEKDLLLREELDVNYSDDSFTNADARLVVNRKINLACLSVGFNTPSTIAESGWKTIMNLPVTSSVIVKYNITLGQDEDRAIEIRNNILEIFLYPQDINKRVIHTFFFFVK